MVSRTGRQGNVDRGWCWVIAAACCWITFVTQGLLRCGGVVFVSVIDAFHITRGQASWPFTLRIAIWNLSGPVIGALCFYWSIRTISICGIILLTLGNALCWFASDITTVVLFLGVLQGVGTGMAVTLVPVIINQYFVKYKSTGIGIACAGATVGSFALPPLLEFLLEEYGLGGGFLLMGAITLQGLVGSAFLRPAEWLKPPKEPSRPQPLSLRESAPADAPGVDDGCDEKLMTNGTPVINGGPVNDKDEPPGGATDAAKHSALLDGKQKEEDDDGETECKERSWNFVLSAVRGVVPHIKMATAILANPFFAITAFNFSALFLSYMTYLTVVVDFAQDQGISRVDSVFLVSSFSLADLGGRLGFGWLTDKGIIRRRNLMMLTMLLLGMFFAVSPIVVQYTSMMAITVVMGVLVGISLVVTYPLLEEYIGLPRLPLALGFMNFMNGCISLIAPVITGIFRDKIGTYDHLFHFLGAACMLGGLLWALEHSIQACRTECGGNNRNKHYTDIIA